MEKERMKKEVRSSSLSFSFLRLFFLFLLRRTNGGHRYLLLSHAEKEKEKKKTENREKEARQTECKEGPVTIFCFSFFAPLNLFALRRVFIHMSTFTLSLSYVSTVKERQRKKTEKERQSKRDIARPSVLRFDRSLPFFSVSLGFITTCA
jgi:cell division protein FtsI/penicillin-binding protein 2